MKKLFLLGILTIVVAGCSDFLDVQPKSFSNAKTFYDSQSGIQEGVNGAYNSLQILYDVNHNDRGSAFWAMAEMRSDNTTFQYNESNRGALQREQIDYFQVTPDNNYIEDVWSTAYNGIAQCNAVLDNIDNVEMSDSARNRATGQAKFIRSLHYFNLVRMFGGVPLVLQQVSSRDEAFSENGRATADEVYTQIIEDVQDAINKLPVSWPEDEVGRATKGAANTLLGEIYLTRQQYQDAIESFQEVIQSTNYSLVSRYADLYETSNENNSESIFEIQYSASIEGEASAYIYSFAPINSGSVLGFTETGGETGRNIPTRNIQRTYEEGDSRKEASISWYVDPGNTQYVEAQHDSVPYIKKYATPPTQPDRQEVNFYVYRYSQVLLWMAEAMNEVGQTGQAHAHINNVRTRAGLDPLSGLSQDAFRDAVYHEERVESAFENHRWFQLKRTGRAVDLMAQNGKEQKSYQTWLSSSAYTITEDKRLYPIPLREVNLNDLKQNPGW